MKNLKVVEYLEKYTILINIFHLGVNNTILVGDVFECELLIRLNVDQVYSISELG